MSACWAIKCDRKPEYTRLLDNGGMEGLWCYYHYPSHAKIVHVTEEGIAHAGLE